MSFVFNFVSVVNKRFDNTHIDVWLPTFLSGALEGLDIQNETYASLYNQGRLECKAEKACRASSSMPVCSVALTANACKFEWFSLIPCMIYGMQNTSTTCHNKN